MQDIEFIYNFDQLKLNLGTFMWEFQCGEFDRSLLITQNGVLGRNLLITHSGEIQKIACSLVHSATQASE